VGCVRFWFDQIDEGFAKLPQRGEDPLANFDGAGVADGDDDDCAAVKMPRQERCRRRLS
jgi:hypothetical protein